jgi:hypothetical protein
MRKAKSANLAHECCLQLRNTCGAITNFRERPIDARLHERFPSSATQSASLDGEGTLMKGMRDKLTTIASKQNCLEKYCKKSSAKFQRGLVNQTIGLICPEAIARAAA